MASEVPTTMRALALAKNGKPKEYAIASLPLPRIVEEDDVLVRVHAASVNPIDVKMADFLGPLFTKGNNLPWKIGYDLSGTVVAVGPSVTAFKPGDEVFSRVDSKHRGTIAEYCLASASRLAIKPKSMSFVDAASIPLAGQTALQAMVLANDLLKEEGGLKGKTVFVPAALSGTGSFGVQLAKNCFGAGKVISTVSTGKVSQVEPLLGKGVVDVLVDYVKEKDVVGAVGKVDFMFDTVGQSIAAGGTVRKGGVLISISTVPSGSEMKKNYPGMRWWLEGLLNVMNWAFMRYFSWKGVRYSYLSRSAGGEALDQLAGYYEEGKLKAVVGRTARFEDIESVRGGCQEIYDGKGGIGKFVIEIV